MKKFIYLIFGVAFGFILSRAGATTYDYYAKLFLFQDFQLLFVILGAVIVGVLGFTVLKKLRVKQLFDKSELSYKKKPFRKTLVMGSLLFGIGWGLAGACPGTALAMLGEGKIGAFITIMGILVGTYFYRFFASFSE